MALLSDEELMEKISKAIAYNHATTVEMNGPFAHVAQGMRLAAEQSGRPDIHSLVSVSGSMLSGALIVHLFAMWDQHFEHEDVDLYFDEQEKQRFYAFKHLRHVYAHNIHGHRKGNKPGKERMGHAEKLDEVIGSSFPIEGVDCTSERLWLTFPDSFCACQGFLASMALKLGTLRFSTVGAGKVVRKPA